MRIFKKGLDSIRKWTWKTREVGKFCVGIRQLETKLMCTGDMCTTRRVVRKGSWKKREVRKF